MIRKSEPVSEKRRADLWCGFTQPWREQLPEGNGEVGTLVIHGIRVNAKVVICNHLNSREEESFESSALLDYVKPIIEKKKTSSTKMIF